jgi:hypothetical protein
MRIKNLFQGSPLKLVGLGGLVIVLVLVGVFVVLSLTRDLDIFPQGTGSSFSRDLRAYDDAAKTERPDQLGQRLDRLERRARAQEQWLSLPNLRVLEDFLEANFLFS